MCIRDSERAESGHAHLPAMRMARKQQGIAEPVPSIEYPQIGRMGHPDGEICALVGRLVIEFVVAEVWIVHADERQFKSLYSQFAVPIGQIQPAAISERGAQFTPGQVVSAGDDGAVASAEKNNGAGSW